MGACNKSDAKQSSKNKNKWEARRNAKTWEVKKDKRVATEARRKEAIAARKERREKAGKPVRGAARKLRRAK